MISISTPSRSSSGAPRAPRASSAPSCAARRRRLVVGDRRRLTAEHARRPVALGDEAQATAAAGEQLAGQLLEVACGGLEGLLERLADLAVGVGDQLLELAQRRLEIGALALELLDVLDRLGVLLLRERVDRAELLAAPRESLDPRA